MEEKFSTLLYLLQRFAESVMGDAEEMRKAILPEITACMTEIFPAIISSYDRPEMSDYREDANYWVEQIKRMTETLAGEDVFAQLDVLYFEICANLIEYKTIINGRGLTL